MAKRAKGRGSRSAEEKPRAERTNAGGGPERPQDLAMIVEVLAPARIETLRRQLIDGKTGQIEPLLWKVAYSGPLDPERTRPRWVRSAQFWAELGGQVPPDLPLAEERKPSPAGGETIESATADQAGYRINWDKVVLETRRRARALVEAPAYQESLRRRLADGKAPAMLRLLWQWADTKSRDPYEQRRGRPPLSIVMDHRPGEHDPLADREQAMLKRQAEQEEQEARARQEASDKPAAPTAATPDEPSDADTLELVRIPEP